MIFDIDARRIQGMRASLKSSEEKVMQYTSTSVEIDR